MIYMDIIVVEPCWVMENSAVLKRCGNKQERFVKERVPSIRLVCCSGYSCGFQLISHQGFSGVICGFGERGCLAEWRNGIHS